MKIKSMLIIFVCGLMGLSSVSGSAQAANLSPGDYSIVDTSGNNLGQYDLDLGSDASLVVDHDGQFCRGSYTVSNDPTRAFVAILTLQSSESGCSKYNGAEIKLSAIPALGDRTSFDIVDAGSLFPARKNIDTHKICIFRNR